MICQIPSYDLDALSIYGTQWSAIYSLHAATANHRFVTPLCETILSIVLSWYWVFNVLTSTFADACNGKFHGAPQ